MEGSLLRRRLVTCELKASLIFSTKIANSNPLLINFCFGFFMTIIFKTWFPSILRFFLTHALPWPRTVRLRRKANAKFKLRISQNRIRAAKNSPKKPIDQTNMKLRVLIFGV